MSEKKLVLNFLMVCYFNKDQAIIAMTCLTERTLYDLKTNLPFFMTKLILKNYLKKDLQSSIPTLFLANYILRYNFWVENVPPSLMRKLQKSSTLSRELNPMYFFAPRRMKNFIFSLAASCGRSLNSCGFVWSVWRISLT